MDTGSTDGNSPNDLALISSPQFPCQHKLYRLFNDLGQWLRGFTLDQCRWQSLETLSVAKEKSPLLHLFTFSFLFIIFHDWNTRISSTTMNSSQLMAITSPEILGHCFGNTAVDIAARQCPYNVLLPLQFLFGPLVLVYSWSFSSFFLCKKSPNNHSIISRFDRLWPRAGQAYDCFLVYFVFISSTLLQHILAKVIKNHKLYPL